MLKWFARHVGHHPPPNALPLNNFLYIPYFFSWPHDSATVSSPPSGGIGGMNIFPEANGAHVGMCECDALC